RRAIACAEHGDAPRGTGRPAASLPPRTARRLSEGRSGARDSRMPFDIIAHYSIRKVKNQRIPMFARARAHEAPIVVTQKPIH
ncbi:MAG: hypothetical protein IJJ45_04335, partial [Clostridia bacterium]|nr:hypothetical protein [Clostridia bacterium]